MFDLPKKDIPWDPYGLDVQYFLVMVPPAVLIANLAGILRQDMLAF